MSAHKDAAQADERHGGKGYRGVALITEYAMGRLSRLLFVRPWELLDSDMGKRTCFGL
jgi:hypothetical protein